MQLSNLEPAFVPGGSPRDKGCRQHHLLAKKDTALQVDAAEVSQI